MTEEKFLEIMDDEDGFDSSIEGDCNLAGFQIMAKYVDKVIEGADHDIVYGPDLNDLIDNGITEEEVQKLRALGFHVEDECYLATYV